MTINLLNIFAMKTTLLLSIFLLSNYTTIFAQENNIQDSIDTVNLPKNELYILDSIKKYRDLRIFKMNDPYYYLQIFDGYAVFTYQSRLKGAFASGQIYRSSINIIEGDSVNTFTIVTDNNFAGSVSGKRIFIGVLKNDDTNYTIFILNNGKTPEYIIKAHIASTEEKNILIKRSEE